MLAGQDSGQERMIAERRITLSAYGPDDDSTSDSTSARVAALPFDPRAVSVVYLATTRCTSDAEAPTADTGSADRVSGADGASGASGDGVVLSPVPRRRSWWRRVFGSGTDPAGPGGRRRG